MFSIRGFALHFREKLLTKISLTCILTVCCALKFSLAPTDRTTLKTTLFRRKNLMVQLRNITTLIALAFVFTWMSGCGGCNPEPLPSGMSPAEGPETGGTTVRISGEKFDMKNGVTVTLSLIHISEPTRPY